MRTYQICHREELVGYYSIDADSPEDALAEYQYLVSEGKIDFSDLEMVDSSDEVVRDATSNPKFVVHITEIYGKDVVVEAADADEAKDIVRTEHSNDRLRLYGADFVTSSIETIRTASPDDCARLRMVYSPDENVQKERG